MLDFNDKMHQNRFRIPRPRWGSLQLDLRGLLLRGGKGNGQEGRGGEGRGGEGRSTCLPPRFQGREREGRGRGQEGRERGEEGKGKGGRERDLAQ